MPRSYAPRAISVSASRYIGKKKDRCQDRERRSEQESSSSSSFLWTSSMSNCLVPTLSRCLNHASSSCFGTFHIYLALSTLRTWAHLLASIYLRKSIYLVVPHPPYEPHELPVPKPPREPYDFANTMFAWPNPGQTLGRRPMAGPEHRVSFAWALRYEVSDRILLILKLKAQKRCTKKFHRVFNWVKSWVDWFLKHY